MLLLSRLTDLRDLHLDGNEKSHFYFKLHFSRFRNSLFLQIFEKENSYIKHYHRKQQKYCCSQFLTFQICLI